MQSSGLTYESIRSNLTSAKLNLLPEVSLDLGVRNDFYHPETPTASNITSSAGFSISKSLSLNDTYWYNYKYAQLDEKKGALDLQSKISSYAYNVFTAYLNVLSSQKQLLSLNKNLEIQTRVWEQTKVLNQLGKNTSFDVKESEIAVMNSRISIMQLENTIATMRRELFGLVNMEDEGYDLADLEPDKELTIPDFSPEKSYAIKTLQNELSRTQLSLKQNKTDFLPQLKLTYSFARNAGGEDFSFESYNTEHTLSLGVSYSIWNQFKQKQTVKRSNLSVRMVELNLQDQLDAMERQYEILTRELEYLKRWMSYIRNNWNKLIIKSRLLKNDIVWA
jgi:outer membrane protein TolC